MNEKMNKKIDETDAYILHSASVIYQVPYEVLTSIYNLGFNEGRLRIIKGE